MRCGASYGQRGGTSCHCFRCRTSPTPHSPHPAYKHNYHRPTYMSTPPHTQLHTHTHTYTHNHIATQCLEWCYLRMSALIPTQLISFRTPTLTPPTGDASGRPFPPSPHHHQHHGNSNSQTALVLVRSSSPPYIDNCISLCSHPKLHPNLTHVLT